MLPLYLFALIVGGGLLAFSLLWGEAGEHDADLDADADAEAGAGSLVDATGNEWAMLRGFLSVRTVVHFLAGFGATGMLLETLTAASSPVTLFWAATTGAVAATLAALIYGWVRSSGSGDVSMDPELLVGATATVLLPVEPGRRGKIIALRGDREVEMLARLHSADEPGCPRGSEVVIVEVVGETALITPLPSLSSGIESE